MNLVSENSTATPAFIGRWVVVGMFAFAALMTALLWAYWELHTRPFRDLQTALAREFPESSPRVEGGAHKSHLNTPTRLRFMLRVQFDPTTNQEESVATINKAVELARETNRPDEFDELEFHLFQKREQGTPTAISVTRPPTDFPISSDDLAR